MGQAAGAQPHAAAFSALPGLTFLGVHEVFLEGVPGVSFEHITLAIPEGQSDHSE